MLVLSEDDVRKVLSRSETLLASHQAFLAIGGGSEQERAVVPARTIIDVPCSPGTGAAGPRDTLFKPAALGRGKNGAVSVGLKVVSVRPENASQKLPTVPGYIFLVNPDTGLAEALLAATVCSWFALSWFSALEIIVAAMRI